ncbi:hypothetical protein A2U01_0028368 [Trifolium medium]|uniref:Uncharacterized protein n=1 Tax=Trifolium medium TaxID=97028 RepID=A0A392P693_9FABA|nr:hypothetical protein [Trifolium medium]
MEIERVAVQNLMVLEPSNSGHYSHLLICMLKGIGGMTSRKSGLDEGFVHLLLVELDEQLRLAGYVNELGSILY